jgi:hypothetical protein
MGFCLGGGRIFGLGFIVRVSSLMLGEILVDAC